ncbi:MAG TPA: DUF5995 family protein [Kofleriaceae bacterium]|nr:DUF5995 family protein [Kofleriaceae bacterium]
MSGVFPDGTTLDTVVETMAGMAFPADDGVRHFHAIYTDVTREVARRVAAGGFEDPAFMVALDVEFAGLYLEALRAPATAPRAWRVVFARRTQRLAALRFALAGMNAHINRDLCVALERTCERLGGGLERDSARCRDFVAINDILEALMARAKTEVFSRVDQLLDLALGSLDDLFETWSITAARDAAWSAAAALLELAPGEARDNALRSIDRTASLIGRLLLL